MAISYLTFRFGRPLMVDFIDTGAAHLAGDVVVQGNANLVCHSDLAQSVQGAAAIGMGVYDAPKSTAVGSGALLAFGTPVCWNATTHTIDPDLANGQFFGISLGSLTTPLGTPADADTQVRVLQLPNIVTQPVRVSTVAAAGNAQGNAAAIPNEGFVWVTGANAAVGVILPALPNVGDVVEIKNDDTANAVLLVYPQTGAKINALAANGAISMAAKASARFTAYSATQWFTDPTVPS